MTPVLRQDEGHSFLGEHTASKTDKRWTCFLLTAPSGCDNASKDNYKTFHFNIYDGAGSVSSATSTGTKKNDKEDTFLNDKGVFLKVNEWFIGNDLTVLSFIGKTRRQQILL